MKFKKLLEELSIAPRIEGEIKVDFALSPRSKKVRIKINSASMSGFKGLGEKNQNFLSISSAISYITDSLKNQAGQHSVDEKSFDKLAKEIDRWAIATTDSNKSLATSDSEQQKAENPAWDGHFFVLLKNGKYYAEASSRKKTAFRMFDTKEKEKRDKSIFKKGEESFDLGRGSTRLWKK